ncbi:hypothetical protein A6S26_14915 [Nostoc sp. ATCC 43529]|nr:hypothetical protein A6S26_14915 [Nostoc sp. ATCC 43529]
MLSINNFGKNKLSELHQQNEYLSKSMNKKILVVEDEIQVCSNIQQIQDLHTQIPQPPILGGLGGI